MYKTDFPVIRNLPQRFTATISAKVRRHVFSAVSHNIRIAGARGHVRSSAMNVTLFGDHIFPYGDLKRKIQSPVGACLKKLISDPVTTKLAMLTKLAFSEYKLYFSTMSGLQHMIINYIQ